MSAEPAMISIRELRNDVSEIVRRAESGEEMVVTVRGRPVAQLGPLGRRRPRFIPFRELEEGLRRIEPDPDFAAWLREGEQTTDDVVLPWDDES